MNLLHTDHTRLDMGVAFLLGLGTVGGNACFEKYLPNTIINPFSKSTKLVKMMIPRKFSAIR